MGDARVVMGRCIVGALSGWAVRCGAAEEGLTKICVRRAM